MEKSYTREKKNIDPSRSSTTISEMSNRKRDRQWRSTKTDQVLTIERERRKKMTQMFTHLSTIVPAVNIIPNVTRELIVNETIDYIKELEEKKKMLEEMKEMMMKPVEGSFNLMIPCCNRNCSVTVTVSSNVAFFGIESVAKRGLITVILKVFFDNRTEILAANVSVNNGNLILAITALVQNCGSVDKIKREIMSL